MYNSYFGFAEFPFNITPNPRFFYHTPSHHETIVAVQNGIESRKGIMVVTGEPGFGKTLLLKLLMQRLQSNVTTVYVRNSQIEFDELLDLLLDRLGVPVPPASSAAKVDIITRSLSDQMRQGKIVALLIDEAQDLSLETLDKLRLLSNLDIDDDALLPIVLVGQPDLEENLDKAAVWRFKQRVALSRHLYPLLRKDIAPYIDYRLRVAKYSGDCLFEPESVEVIGHYSRGIPRLINTLCDNALLKTFAQETKFVTVKIVEQVARELRIGGIHPTLRQFVDSRAAASPAPEGALGAQEPAAAFGAPAAREENSAATQREPIELRHPVSEPGGESGSAAALQPSPAPKRNYRPFPLRWFGVAAITGLLMLAIGSIVRSAQLTGVHGMAALAQRSLAAGPAKTPVPPAAQPAPEPTNIAAVPVSTPSAQNIRDTAPEAAEPAPAGSAPIRPAPPPADPSGAGKSSGGRNPIASKASEPASANDTAAAQKTAAAAKRIPPVPILRVVADSLIRNKPSDKADVVRTLVAGIRVKILNRSHDYFYVTAVDSEALRGYVHREDAFFSRIVN